MAGNLNQFNSNPDGSVGPNRTPNFVRKAIEDGSKKRDYSNIRVPNCIFRPRPLLRVAGRNTTDSSRKPPNNGRICSGSTTPIVSTSTDTKRICDRPEEAARGRVARGGPLCFLDK